MSILQITPDYPPNPLWGMGWHVHFLTKALWSKGLDVLVATAHKSLGLHSNIITSLESDDDDLLSAGKYEIFDDFNKFNKWQEKLAERIIESRKSIEVIHCHNWMSWITSKIVKEHYKNTKVVTTFHLLQRQYECMKENPIPSFHEDIIEIETEAANESDYVIVLGESQMNIIRNKYSLIDKDKAILLPSGVDFSVESYGAVEKIRASNPHTDIIFVGRLEEDKGIRETLSAFEDLAKEQKNIRLHVVGKGPLLDELSAIYTSDRVIFHGFIEDRGRLIELLTLSSIFCMPSTSEALATSVIEAMIFGTVPIFSEGPTVPNLYSDNECGLKIPLHSKGKKFVVRPSDVYDAMKKLVVNKRLRNRLARNACALSNNKYSLKSTADKIESLYRKK